VHTGGIVHEGFEPEGISGTRAVADVRG